ncbi:MAG: threonine synthase, partial [Planctomycetota bacterium]
MHDTPHSRFVSHLEAAIDGTRFEPNQSLTTHDGRPIWVRYDLDAVRRAVRRDDLRDRPASMWRYRELLPLGRDDDQISLGETMTPLVPCPTLARAFDVAE